MNFLKSNSLAPTWISVKQWTLNFSLDLYLNISPGWTDGNSFFIAVSNGIEKPFLQELHLYLYQCNDWGSFIRFADKRTIDYNGIKVWFGTQGVGQVD